MQDHDEWGYQNFAAEFSSAAYEPDNANFAGSFKEYWSGKQLMIVGDYLPEFKKTGVHRIYWDNGELREIATWKNGFIVGTLLRFRSDGTLKEERFFGNGGQRDWQHIERVYDESQRLSFVYETKPYKTIQEWTCEEIVEADGAEFIGKAISNGGPDWEAEKPLLASATGMVRTQGTQSKSGPKLKDWGHQEFTKELSAIEGIPDLRSFSGQFRKSWPSGAFKTLGEYESGKRRGVHLGYWENGQLREVAAWKNGFAIGTMLRFRSDGSLEEEYFFGNGGQQPWHYIHRSYDISQGLVGVREVRGDDVLQSHLMDQVSLMGNPPSAPE